MSENVLDVETSACKKIKQRREYTVVNVLRKTKDLNIALIALNHGIIHQVIQIVEIKIAIWIVM